MTTSDKRKELLAQQIYHCKESFENKIKPIESFYEILRDFIQSQESYSREIQNITEKVFKSKEDKV